MIEYAAMQAHGESPEFAPCGCPVQLQRCRTCGVADFPLTDCHHDMVQPTECSTCAATWSA